MKADHLDATFAALADPTRRAILWRPPPVEANVTELACPFDMSQPAISKHLTALSAQGSSPAVATRNHAPAGLRRAA